MMRRCDSILTCKWKSLSPSIGQSGVAISLADKQMRSACGSYLFSSPTWQSRLGFANHLRRPPLSRIAAPPRMIGFVFPLVKMMTFRAWLPPPVAPAGHSCLALLKTRVILRSFRCAVGGIWGGIGRGTAIVAWDLPSGDACFRSEKLVVCYRRRIGMSRKLQARPGRPL